MKDEIKDPKSIVASVVVPTGETFSYCSDGVQPITLQEGEKSSDGELKA